MPCGPPTRAVALAFAAAALLAGVRASTASPGASKPRVVALAVNESTSISAWRAFPVATRGGARGAFVSFTWKQLEPAPGRYRLDGIGGLRELGRERGLTFLVNLAVVNGTVRETPGDLASEPFDSPRLIARFRRLVAAIRPSLARNVLVVAVGNEVDLHLAGREAAWQSYGRFYAQAVAALHAAVPGMRVGVTTTFSGTARTYPRRVARLNRASDVQIVTYYPLERSLAVRPPTAPRQDFPRLLKLTGQRPLVFQEVGYPTSARLGSSEQKQARFVDEVFAAWARGRSRIPFLTFFQLHDLTPRACGDIARYYGRAGDAHQAYLCFLGLRRADGSPKPAWEAFARGASKLR
ncbi:MAG: hypothetical protein M3322_05955 [Actinomycetota bacterium]|nr:hypothetical protein [Actinomycetota bacterium]